MRAIGKVHTNNLREDGRRDLSRLKIALALTFVYMLAEAAGGWWTNSLALLADAGHMLTDVGALTLTLAAIWFAARPATPNKTYGYYRLEILAAFVNGVVLALISVFIIYEAYVRWQDPPPVKGLGLTLIAAGGLVVNLAAAALLHGRHEHDLNIRGAWLHVIGDALGSVAALLAGVLIVAFGWLWTDAVTSVVISLIIIFGAWRLIRESVNVLLEGTPSHINLNAVKETILGHEQVSNVHDLHVWTITSGMDALSVHIVHRAEAEPSILLESVRGSLHEEFGIDHLTIQLETEGDEGGSVYRCIEGANCFKTEIG